jgi:hypothetical protein
MTDHRPECHEIAFCICYELDACEKRVREDQTKILNSRVQYQSGYTDGYRDALEAIRDANINLINE